MESITPNTQDNKCTVKPSEQEILNAIRTMMLAIGEDPDREGLQNTPDRIIRMWQEIFRGYDATKKPRITTFKNSAHSTEMVFDCGEYYSMCEHHILPFFGKYYFAYIPSAEGRILGISKIARVVGYCAARLQLQERLAREIIDMLSAALDDKAEGFAIVMKGKHMCKTMRGVKNKGDMTVSYFTGCFKKNRQLRNEFFQMINMQ
ncbi:MAG: GTP cyclohydrolase I [Prevotella sp.]|nr:GTP cyclohydrolase I [Candidatus Prevotella equi]